MTNLDALRRAICAAPEDDIVRGAFADALDDEAGGYSERAEFIRVQCELAKPYDEHAYTFWRGQLDTPKDVQHRDALRQREQELLEKWNRTWFYPTREQVLGYEVTRGFISEVRAPLSVLIGGACERCIWPTEQLDGSVRDEPVQWLPSCPACPGTGRTVGVLPGIVQREPVVKVVATGLECHQLGEGVAWVRDDSGEWTGGVPTDLFQLIKSSWPRANGEQKAFISTEEAHSALSAALLAWAKVEIPST